MVGAELVIRALARRAVRTIFSLSGNQIMPLYDACIDAGIRIVHVRHEAAAVFMADAWAQVTGEVGVALLTAGPGLSNGIAPLYSALQAESPVLLLSGDSSVAEDGLGAFQEMDQAAITAPVTKLSKRVLSTDALAAAIDLAMDTALAPRRGPVHLALPFDVLTARVQAEALLTQPPRPAAARATGAARLGAQDARILADALSHAQRPMVLAGPAAAREMAARAWRAWSGRHSIPVVAMESPRGLRDPAAGAVAVQIAQSDLLVLAGKRLDFTLGFGRGQVFHRDARVLVVDPDPAMLDRARQLLGDRLCHAVLADPDAIVASVAALSDTRVQERSAWLAQVQSALAVRASAATPAVAAGRIGSRELCALVQRFLDEVAEPIVVCDGGEFGQWAQAFCQGRVRIVNGMSGAIGGGICYAIAAKLARPDATVLALMGDGTSGFHFMEFDTAVRENAPFVAVIGNDLRWNAEHLIQLRAYGADRLIGCGLADTARYDLAAQALGGFGVQLSAADAVLPALRAAVQSGRPACLNVDIDSQPAPVYADQAAATH
jgi:acetolactate synthase-1/2/3 large subunit